jgi:hypothetical protein
MAKFTVGQRVRLTNPKSVAHYDGVGMATCGVVTRVEEHHFKPKSYWAPDVPVEVRRDTDMTGYFVQLDGQTGEPNAYRQSELAREQTWQG